ncbi:MAG: tRNA uridine-5-carboxymethylaminomethyl(34) synthesis GTPase MnmE [Oceanococcus sp.]
MTESIAAIATAPGQGGVGIVRVSGALAHQAAHKLAGFQPRIGQTQFARFRAADERLIDEGVLLSFAAPRSFTGEDVVEFQIHGGPWVLQSLLDELLRQFPIRLARPGEFTERAFLNGKLDLVQAEAVADLIAAGSSQAAQAAQRSLSGVFSRSCQSLHDGLLDLRLRLEAAIDFPEEEIDFLSDPELMRRWQVLHVEHRELLSKAQQGVQLNQGITVVLAGAPNVGKSSLLNFMARHDAAIVSDVPGTTRDVLSQSLQLNGVPVTLIDTAGLRETTDVVEQEGVRRARAAIVSADFLIHVVAHDVVDEMPPNSEARCIKVRNKVDLTEERSGWLNDERLEIAVSAHTGAGMEDLIDTLVGQAGEGDFTARQRHVDSLHRLGENLQRAGKCLEHGDGDLAAEELRLGQQSLGEITGQVHNDELLGHIFSSFCIGK